MRGEFLYRRMATASRRSGSRETHVARRGSRLPARVRRMAGGQCRTGAIAMSPNLRDQTCFPSDMLQLLRWLLVVPLLAMAAGAHAEEKQCQLRRVMSLDMHTGRDGRVAIPVTIENHPASLLVDIGAAYSTLDASFAKSAGLSQKQISGTVIYMGG